MPATPEPKRFPIIGKTALLTLGLLLALVAIVIGTRVYLQHHHQSLLLSSLVTKPLDHGPVSLVIKASGTLNPVVLVDVGTQVSGTISHLYVDYNSTVKKNQILAELDPNLLEAQLKQDEATLRSAKTNLAIASSNAKRLHNLLPKGYVAQSDVDTADNTLATAQSQLAVATAAVIKDHTNLGYTVIRSPVSGIVISRNVNVGQTVAASFQTPTLFVIAQDLTKMQIDLSLDEADVGHVRPGQHVQFSVDAYPKRIFDGNVRMIRNDSTIQQNVVTYDVVINTGNPDLVLRPGMTAYASIMTDQRSGVLRVPNEALQIGGSGLIGRAGTKREPGWDGIVYLLRHQHLMPVQVHFGLQGDTYTEITSSSRPLEDGDLLVTGVNVTRPARG